VKCEESASADSLTLTVGASRLGLIHPNLKCHRFHSRPLQRRDQAQTHTRPFDLLGPRNWLVSLGVDDLDDRLQDLNLCGSDERFTIHCKNIPISTDILWRVFHIFNGTGSV